MLPPTNPPMTLLPSRSLVGFNNIDNNKQNKNVKEEQVRDLPVLHKVDHQNIPPGFEYHNQGVYSNLQADTCFPQDYMAFHPHTAHPNMDQGMEYGASGSFSHVVGNDPQS